MKTNRSRRFLTLLTALLALSMFAAACGGSDDTESATGTATSECGTNNAVVKGDKVTDKTVAVVAPSDSQDLAFTQSMIDSLTRLGIEPQVTDGTFQVEVAADAIRGYAEDGINVVIVHGTQYGGSLAEIAPDFPETSFIWGTSTSTQDIPNIFAYYPEAQQGGYVNGWIAGELADGGSIGVVGPVEAGDAVSYINGFRAGAEANGADVAVTYTGSFSDVALATEAAEAFLTVGVEVLTGTSQSAVGAVNVANENKIPWFGTQSNQEAWSTDQVVASQVYHWEVILDDMFEMIDEGTLGGEAMSLTLENGGLLVEINGCYNLDSDVLSGAGDIVDQIIAGDINPPA
jgi:basic membrane protein A